MKILHALALIALVAGCATLKSGSNPLVVRAEQTETAAKASFDLVLHINHANRAFWATNAPAFGSFCDWLRVQTPYQGTNVSRATRMMFDLDDLKIYYKGAKTASSSNALFTAVLTLEQALSQAAAWQTIATMPVIATSH